MKRQPKTKKIGFLNVDKPSGILSSAVVNKIKWLTGAACGHMGTLDPLASGVLPVGVGNATRLFDYFLEKKKEYIAEFTFGVSSDTLDSTGELLFGGRIPSLGEIETALPALCGEVLQIPPKYSAKNVNGRRGYDLARAGIDFELAPKKVVIYGMKLLGEAEKENTVRVQIECGGGTYIRSIGRDLAAALGTNAVMSALRRVKSGFFTLGNSVPYEELTKDGLSIEELEDMMLPTEAVLPFERIELTTRGWQRIFNGVALPTENGEADGNYKFYNEDGSFYGIAEVQNGLVKLKTKLC